MNQTTTTLAAYGTGGSVQPSLKSRFEALKGRRSQVVSTAVECSKLTIPALLPEYPDSTGYKAFPKNYNSLGARAVHNLGSKLMVALFPPSSPFYKLTANEVIVQQLAELDAKQTQDAEGPGLKSKVEERLSVLESIIMNRFERTTPRARTYECIKLLIVTGNALVRKMPEKPLKIYNLHNYVVTRDGEGEWTELIIRETVGYSTLSTELKALVAASALGGSSDGSKVLTDPLNAVVELYTVVERAAEKGRYNTWQELGNIHVPNSDGSYSLDKVPYLVLRWNAVTDEDYGRGMVEDYLGDLRCLENNAETMDKVTRACGKLIPMVNPNSTTRVERLNRAKDGEFVYGNPDDIRFFTVDKLQDFSVINSRAQEIRADIKAAFLMNSVVQRSGERVTAEEIRTVAAELEEALGGVYSVLSQEFQLPLVRLLYEEAQDEFRKLNSKFDLELGKELNVEITTGLDAIGRGNDANKLRLFIGALKELGDPGVYSWIVVADLIKRLGLSYGIDMKGLVLNPEQRQQLVQAAQQQSMMQNVLGSASQAIPKLIENNADKLMPAGEQ